MKKVITRDAVVAEHKAGRTRIDAPRATTVITPEAWSAAHELGLTFITNEKVSPRRVSDGSAKTVDPSGVVVVRGGKVKLDRFAGAGAGKNVRLADVITGGDGSPMTAGFMEWHRDDSFEWMLDYDEVDYVLEGVLEITIDGRTVEGHAGDVLYIPKGSRIVFGTPSRVRVFYVTYPANWKG